MSNANKFWVGGTGNWSDDDSHWATESGGDPGDGNIPTSSDNVYFDANSFSAGSQTVTIDEDAYCLDMDWTGVTDSPALAFEVNDDIYIYGSLTFASGMSIASSNSGFRFMSTGTETITTDGLDIGASFFFSDSGTFNFQDEYTSSAPTYSIAIVNGSNSTVNTNNNTMNLKGMYFLAGGGGTLNLGSSTVNVSSSWATYNSGYTFNAGTSTINLTGPTFYGGPPPASGSPYTFNVVNVNPSSGNATMRNGGIFDTLTISAGKEITFETDVDFEVSTFTATGTSGNEIYLQSDSAGTQFTLSKASGTVTADYCDIKDSSATGGARWIARHSTNSGNNTGWYFLPTPRLALMGVG